jgi:hypothetical protein
MHIDKRHLTPRNIAITIAALLFAWLVWPTMYRYDHVPHPSKYANISGATSLVRINRITGKVSRWYGSSWR